MILGKRIFMSWPSQPVVAADLDDIANTLLIWWFFVDSFQDIIFVTDAVIKLTTIVIY